MSKKFKLHRFLAGEWTRVSRRGGYKDVQFVGFMCVANNGENEVYFTIDEDGNAMNSYNDNPLGLDSSLSFSLRHKKSKAKSHEILPCDETEPSKEKPDVVEIVRYFRRLDSETGAVLSSGGLTVVCRLNYDTMRMQVFPAFCSTQDNFNKSAGLAAATKRRENNVGIEFSFDRELPIRDNLAYALYHDTYAYTSKDVLQNIILYREFEKCV